MRFLPRSPTIIIDSRVLKRESRDVNDSFLDLLEDAIGYISKKS
jgi:hypothetical protein